MVILIIKIKFSENIDMKKQKQSSVLIPMGDKVSEINLLYRIDNVQSKPLSQILAMYTQNYFKIISIKKIFF